MLAYQVDYWKLQEQKRTNRANEDIGWYNADTNRYNYYVNQQNADTNRLNYFVNERNADINQQNADTNRYNYYVNAQNADTNRLNYFVNAQNAATNAKNAETNRYNYYVNQANAATNRANAATNARQARVAESGQKLKEQQFAFEKSIKPFELETNRISAEGSYLRGAASAYTAPSTVELNQAKTAREKTGRVLDIVNTAGNQATSISKEVREWANYAQANKKNKGNTSVLSRKILEYTFK